MKALSLWQPWASLIAVGAKRVETRGWQVPAFALGQVIAIHASKRTRELGLVDYPPFSTQLEAAKADDRLVAAVGQPRSASVRYMLPLGAIVATARIVRCAPITEQGAATLRADNPDEWAFGNYDLSEGPRFAWVLDQVVALDPPRVCEGAQGLFDVLTGSRRVKREDRRVLGVDELDQLAPLETTTIPRQTRLV